MPFSSGNSKIRLLAVSTARRAAALPKLPKLPNMQESGVKDYDTTLWTGMLVPAGTAREFVTKLNAELLVVLAKSELQVWGTLIMQAGIKLE